MGFNIVPGIGPARLQKLLDHFGDAEKAWHAAPLDLARAGLDRKSLQSLIATRDTLDLERVYLSAACLPLVRDRADVEVLTGLSYAKSGTGHGTRIVLAVPGDHPANSAKEMPPGSRISTEFEHLTKRYFDDLGIEVKVVWSFGATVKANTPFRRVMATSPPPNSFADCT